MFLNGTLAISAYYASWSIYSRHFEVRNLPFANLSHVNYAFADVNSSGHVYLTDLWADAQRPAVRYQGHGGLFGNLGALYEFKREYPHLKVGLSIGGWAGSSHFSSAASTNTARATFAQTALDLILNLGLDFVDLDWEYPVAGGPDGQLHSINDGRNLVLLLQEIRGLFTKAVVDGRWRGTLPPGISLALPCGKFTGRYDYLKEMGELVDFVHMMCYDFTGPWSKVSDHHSNLFSRGAEYYSADEGIKELLATGFPARKTILGIPIYARGFDGCSNLLKPFSGPSAGTWDESGVIDYNTIKLRNGTCIPLIEPKTSATFCHDSKSNRLLVYDSVTVVKKKIDYVKKMGLAGLMFWEASADVYTDPRDGLIAAAKAEMAPFTLDSLGNNLCYPNSKYANINSLQNCTVKTAPNVGEFVGKEVPPINLDDVKRAVPFGPRIHYRQY